MNNSASTLASLIPELLNIAKQAGADIMSVYASSDFGATSKADESPLTLADLASHRTILSGLSKLTPEIPVLSEEASDIPYSQRSQWASFWLVDPLDGTKEFIKRNGEFTVNIALIENGIPILGVVYAPVLDVCYFGSIHTGAFVTRAGDKSEQSARVRLHSSGEAIKVVASRSHSDAHTQALLDKLGEHQCVSMGSSLKLCLVAEGKAHFYPRLGPTMEWDTAAAHAVVNAAGGTVQDKNGQELSYNKQDLHNPGFFVFAKADIRLPQLIKDSFNE